MSDRPLCSVILSSFNRPRLIVDALDSLRAQTWGAENLQVIIADDHSDAPTRDVIAAYQQQHASELHCFVVQPATVPTMKERQFGQRCAVCINAAMEHARGECVAFLCDDDMMFPQSIESRVEFLLDHPQATVVYGKLRACQSMLSVAGLHFEATPACRHDDTCFWSPTPILRAANHVDHGQFMVRRGPRLPPWPEQKTVSVGGESHDCDDAGFLDVLEQRGLGPFYSVDELVICKRYHARAHRGDPSVRE